MVNLNNTNGADVFLFNISQKVLDEFKKNIIGAEFGIAYGGGVEGIGKIWKDSGVIYAFDSYTGHPDYLAGNINSFEARCMDGWRKQYSDETFTIEFIQSELDKQDLNNVILKKGIINSTTDVSYIDHLNYVLLDLDIPQCMVDAYNLIKDKIVEGGYLCLHDVVPEGHIQSLYPWYKTILENDGYELIGEYPSSFLAVLKKR